MLRYRSRNQKTQPPKNGASQRTCLHHRTSILNQLGAYNSPYRILKIRNPWGNTGWTGPLNNQDTAFWSKVHPEDQLKMGYNVDNVGDNGVFFIQWEDFVKYFVIVDICKINDNSNYFYL